MTASGLDGLPGAIPERIRRRAAEWLALREARGFTVPEHADFAEWIAADPRHRAAFAEIAAGWARLDGLAAIPHGQDVAPDPDLLARKRSPIRLVWRVGVGLAAAAAIAVGLWWLQPAAATLRTEKPAAIAQATPTILTLSDGSVVELNIDSQVTEDFTLAERRVRLARGEAHFTVTPNPDRPFVVEAGGVMLRAVGTAFNVRLERESVDVLVTHGRVKVTPAAASASTAVSGPILEARQRVSVPRASSPEVLAVRTLAAPEVQQALRWQPNRIVFEDMPLADVIARFNRGRAEARGSWIRIGDPQLGALRFSGRLRVDDFEGFVEVLEVSFGVTARREPDGEIVLLPR